MKTTTNDHAEAPYSERERLETELAYLEPEAMENPAEYERVKAELEAELAALKVQVGVSEELAVFAGDEAGAARRLVELPEDELRRRVVAAAAGRDEAALWALFRGYLLVHVGAGKHTLENRRLGLLRFLAWAKGRGVNLLRPGRDAGRVYVQALEAEGYSPLTVRSRLSSAKSFYKMLRWSGATSADPFGEVRGPKDPVQPWDRRQAYEHAAVEALVAAAGPRDRALLLLLAHGGLRAMEALRLRWSAVDLGRGVLTVVEGKGGKTAKVSMSGRLVEALRELRGKGTGCGVGGEDAEVIGGSQAGTWRRLKRLADRAGVEFLGLHSFRHYAGTRLAGETGGNLEAVARHLRHSQLETARTYAKMSDLRVRRAVEGW